MENKESLLGKEEIRTTNENVNEKYFNHTSPLKQSRYFLNNPEI